MIDLEDIGVHTSHCCKQHGCKYGDEDCPVAFGEHKQEYPCETCWMETMIINHHENCGICHAEYCEHVQAEIDKRIADGTTREAVVTLAPCPFCGGEATLDGDAEYMTVNIYVTCNKCEASIKIKGGWKHEKEITEEVVTKWNTRKNANV